MSNTFDLNKFNSLLDAAAKTIGCDSLCQQQKQADELKNNYLTAESNLLLADPQYQLAKQNYYTYVSGEAGFNELMEKEYKEKAELIANQFKETYNEEITKINTQLNTYDSLNVNYNNVNDLYKYYKKENWQLMKQLKEDTNDILTNDRKTYYEEQQIGFLNYFYFYVLLTIYIIVIISFIMFSFIYPSVFQWKTMIGIVVIFILLPFISTWILGKIIEFVYFVFGLLPKNVYKTL
jgi:hypothetical protein